jgi:ribosomal protein S18 acetylase RimI-like enzyme
MSDTDVVIEPARVEDAAEILAVQKLAYAIEAQLYNAFDIPPLTEKLGDLESEFEEYIFLKALIDGRLVGSVRARMEGEITCYVGRLAVHPDFQGHGIGTRLMTEIESYFPEAVRFELFTGHKSSRNIHIYEKLGYQVYNRKEVAPDIYLLYMIKNVEARVT